MKGNNIKVSEWHSEKDIWDQLICLLNKPSWEPAELLWLESYLNQSGQQDLFTLLYLDFKYHGSQTVYEIKGQQSQEPSQALNRVYQNIINQLF